ncbi:hypothetical protein GCM10029976_019700 [Kribbella albertanoniae]|uniref:Uncharacterized protein n=1 Tax=Kribbella albertanoniae TaxID=1266829 RepID=A0A4V2XRY1_9ACTN|nr:hypothetical protein [Kribbella albertanoniae]TDC31615.1 hypothetical protein E1261_10340 [Kribbella albertanoniae]
MRSGTQPTAKRWQLAIADTWIGAATSPGSARYGDMNDLSRGIQQLMPYDARDRPEAEAVIDQLNPVLARCDSLPFDTREQCLAYICWHLLDRYGRIRQALDALCTLGHLPIRKTAVTLLEVGAGPSPASYAVGDYYAQFADWCRRTEQPIQPAPAVIPSSVDRGPAWAPLIQFLSEMVPTHGRRRLYGTTYRNFQAFSARQLHHDGIGAVANNIQADFDRADEYLSERQAREFALDQGGFPPSAYDLIILCNFLTVPSMTAAFEVEIRELARSLTPGGILLVLGSPSNQYQPIYAQVDTLACESGFPKLKKVLSQTYQSQDDRPSQEIVARQITSSLSRLQRAAPSAFEIVRQDLAADVKDLDPDLVQFPRFAVHAYKAEGGESISAHDRRRVLRRRSAAGRSS